MLSWLKSLQRNRVLAKPFPRPWQELMHDRVWQYQELSVAERDKLHNCIKVIVAERKWAGYGGMSVSEDMRITIAAHAALMLLGMNDYYFCGVRKVFVHPRAFDQRTPGDELYDTELHGGLARRDGTIELSWDNVKKSHDYSDTASNIVIHEFAHHLDMLEGDLNGKPILVGIADHEWDQVMEREFSDLQAASETGQWTFLPHYGATNKAEFFAVTSECFFENPLELQEIHPEVFDLLQRYYGIDPLRWVS